MIDVVQYRIRIGTFRSTRQRSATQNKTQTQKISAFSAMLLTTLIILGGDIELNPGPTFKEIYEKICSLVSKAQLEQSNGETGEKTIECLGDTLTQLTAESETGTKMLTKH